MCGKNINLISSALLFSLLCLAPGLCSAAPETITMTIQEYNESMTALSELKAYLALSTLDSNESNKLLLMAKEELKKSLAESERLLTLWKTVQSEKEIAQETVRQLRSELSSLKTTFTKYIKENKPKRNSIGVYGNTTSAGVFVTHDRLMLSVGQKWAGGLEAGAGVVVVAW